MPGHFPLLLTGLLVMTTAAVAADRDVDFDVVIRQGRIVDGTGSPAYVADIGIREGRIVQIGRIEADRGNKAIDAAGLIVAPGFVDMMGQTASPMLLDADAAVSLLRQGITTINAGEGVSAAPLSKEDELRHGWTTMAEYFQLIDMRGLPVNVVQTVGHTQVRRIVLGDVDRRPSEQELARMQDLVREGMEAGAIGISTALIYPPAVYAEIEELAALAKTAGEHGGRYFTHMRNEGDRLLDAVDEALEVGRQANVPVHIFHLKAAGRQNWGKMPLAIARIQAARAEGRQVTADIYPYINNGLGIGAFIHPRHFEEGPEKLIRRLDREDVRAEIRAEMETTDGWENWFRHCGHDWSRVIIGQTGAKKYSEQMGRSVAAIAQAHEEDPWETFFQLVRAGAFAMPETMTEANLLLAMRQEFVSFCTDVGPATTNSLASHPRGAGAFPRLLSRYVRDLGAMSLERAVAQASAAACNNVMVYDRGRISEGLAADVIVFDFQNLNENATFAAPREFADGMRYVVVNGQLVLEDGQLTDVRPGRLLRGLGYRADHAPAAISTGTSDPRMASFDHVMQGFLAKHGTPGAAVAVTNQGRLVYARGFGYADIATRDPVEATDLFRIASVSKPITAVAILQLIEREQFGLDDPVLNILDLNAEIDSQPKFDPRQRDITIRHLLEHRGGWDRDKSFDAMFQSVRFAKELGVAPPAGPRDVIRAMLAQPLDFDPGERYAYSNYGYCLLGRVVEKVTGETYETYVQSHVLAPLGIKNMRIGQTRLDQRGENEVRFYHPVLSESVFESDLEQTVPSPYGGWYLEAMDSHGGWLASAVDLARFAAAFDDPDHCPILNRSSIEAMYTRPSGLAGYDDEGQPKETFYSLGWSNRLVGDGKVNHWHNGSLPGTATLLLRRHDGRNIVILCNGRSSPQTDALGREIDRAAHAAANAVEEWPVEDLFPNFVLPIAE